MWIRLLGRSRPLQRRSFCPCTSGFLLYHRLRLFSPGFSFSVLLPLRLPPVFFLPTRNSFKIMQIRYPCHYFLALPRREANFCTNRSALKINVGWRHFILREKTIDRLPVVFSYWTTIENAFTRIPRSSSRFMHGRDKEPPWFQDCTRVLIPIQRNGNFRKKKKENKRRYKDSLRLYVRRAVHGPEIDNSLADNVVSTTGNPLKIPFAIIRNNWWKMLGKINLRL